MIRVPEVAAQLFSSAPGREATARERLEGRQLLLVRVSWLVLAVLVAAVFIATIPGRYADLEARPGSGLPHSAYAVYEIGLFTFAVALFEAVAALLVWHPASTRMALLSALALVTFPVYASPPANIAHIASPWHWSALVLAFVGVIALTLSIYLVPDGRFEPAWTYRLIAPWVLLQGAHQFFPATAWDYTTWSAPLAVAAVASGLGPAIAVMLYRYRSVLTPSQRMQTGWLIWGVVLAVAIVVATELVVNLPLLHVQHNLRASAIADTARLGAVILVPVGIALAIGRHRLWAIDLLIHRTLVYGMLTAIVVGFYVLVVGTLSTVLSGHGGAVGSLLASGVIALLFQPLRARQQRSVNHLMYGERDDPYQLLSRLGRRLEETLSGEAALPVIVETVARALKLPYVAIALPSGGDSIVVAAYGTPVPAPIAFPLVYRQELVGRLLMAPRPGSDDLSAADRRVFGDLTRQAAVAIHASELTAQSVRLSAELQQARSRLVTLREEERKRLRRDLHDGLGPVLASVTLQAENARDLLQSDPVQADAVLADLTAQAQAAIADIRRVVYDLRPPALDDLGLVDAIRIYAERLSGRSFFIRVEVADELPVLPAAVEVAAYRIVQEAVTNVVRHAGATVCTVRLRPGSTGSGSALLIDVMDDGRGLPAGWRPGMGLHSMQARATELCGTCAIASGTAHAGGTHVAATLPLSCEHAGPSPGEGA